MTPTLITSRTESQMTYDPNRRYQIIRGKRAIMWSSSFNTLRGEIEYLLTQGQDIQLKDTLRNTLKTAEELRKELGLNQEKVHGNARVHA